MTDPTKNSSKDSVKGSAKGSKVVGGLVVILVALVALGTGYTLGQDDRTEGSVDCKHGTVLAIDTSGADEQGNGKRTLEVGDCDFISTEAFAAAVDALAARPPATTTTTTTTSVPETGGDDDAEATTTTAAP